MLAAADPAVCNQYERGEFPGTPSVYAACLTGRCMTRTCRARKHGLDLDLGVEQIDDANMK